MFSADANTQVSLYTRASRNTVPKHLGRWDGRNTTGVPRQRVSATRVEPGGVAPVLVCRGLRLSPLVEDVSLEIVAGEAYGLVDPAAAGKTAIVRMICGLFKPDDGTILLGGEPVESLDLGSLKETLGYVPQNAAVTAPSATVLETLRFWARLVGLAPSRRAERIAEVLAHTELESDSHVQVGQCHGGAMRRLGLAVALLHRPRLIVLDEPATGIDAASRDQLHSILSRLCDQGAAVLYTSRSSDDALLLCDRVDVLEEGRLL